MKRLFSLFSLTMLLIVMTGILTAAAALPNPSISLLEPEELLVLNDPGAPTPTITMNVGETLVVRVQVIGEDDQPFISATALPSFQFPGKGVVAVQGGDRAGSGTSATLEVTFKAKSSTAEFPNGGFAPVHVVVGVRYIGGYVVVRDFLFNVTVP